MLHFLQVAVWILYVTVASHAINLRHGLSCRYRFLKGRTGCGRSQCPSEISLRFGAGREDRAAEPAQGNASQAAA